MSKLIVNKHGDEVALQERVSLDVDVPIEWRDAIHRIRGKQTLSDWLRALILRSLRGRGVCGLPVVRDDRGNWDRLARGAMGERRARIERRRRGARDWARRYRARARAAGIVLNHERRVRPVVWDWGADGTVGASDLGQVGASAGYVTSAGEWVSESRHGLEVVGAALVAAMAVDVRVWPDRYRKLAARWQARVAERAGG